jgi:DNA-binding NarL/FixJ family response regulator
MKHKIILVDDEALFRAGLKSLLCDFGNFEIIQEAENGKDLIDNLNKENIPDLILLDLSMPVMDGVDTLKALLNINDNYKIAILSSHYDQGLIVKMIELGAVSFFAKNEDPEKLIEGIKNIIERGFHYTDYIVRLLRDRMVYGQSKFTSLDDISSREKEVLLKICEQKTAKEIAEELFISPRTVEGHRTKLLEKTNSRNIVGLIIFAVERGIFKINMNSFPNF